MSADFFSPRLYTESRQVAPPSKDFVSVNLTSSDLTLHHWKITPSSLRLQNAASSTKTYKTSVGAFLAHGELEEKIVDFFGQATLDTIRDRARGKVDFINRLPDAAKIALIRRLPIEFIPLIRTRVTKFTDDEKICVIADAFGRIAAVAHSGLCKLVLSVAARAAFFNVHKFLKNITFV